MAENKKEIEKEIKKLERMQEFGYYEDRENNIYLLKAELKGRQEATKELLDDEIKFLEDVSEEYWNKHFSMVINKIDNKLKELKQKILRS